jgi:hypothetical protein
MTDEYGAAAGMRNHSTWRKFSPIPLSPSQTPHDWNVNQIWVTAVGSQ